MQVVEVERHRPGGGHRRGFTQFYGMRKLNPMLRGSGRRFNAGSVALKSGAVGAFLLGQKLFHRGRPGQMKSWATLNFSMAATTGAFAVHNYAIRSGR